MFAGRFYLEQGFQNGPSGLLGDNGRYLGGKRGANGQREGGMSCKGATEGP